MANVRGSTGALGRVARALGGFSLLELLVVLALVSLLGALALPNLVGLYASATRATERDAILDQLAAMGRQARLAERGYILRGWPSAPGTPPALGFETYPLTVAADWRVDLDRPLLARPNGVCLGATVTLRHPDADPVQVVLRPPYCLVEEDV